MTLKQIQKDINSAAQKIIGKYCHSCHRSRPLAEFDIIKGKSITRCRDCVEKYTRK